MAALAGTAALHAIKVKAANSSGKQFRTRSMLTRARADLTPMCVSTLGVTNCKERFHDAVRRWDRGVEFEYRTALDGTPSGSMSVANPFKLAPGVGWGLFCVAGG